MVASSSSTRMVSSSEVTVPLADTGAPSRPSALPRPVTGSPTSSDPERSNWCGGKAGCTFELDHRDVLGGIHADHDGSVDMAPPGELGGQPGGIGHDVVVGEHQPSGGEDHAGARDEAAGDDPVDVDDPVITDDRRRGCVRDAAG